MAYGLAIDRTDIESWLSVPRYRRYLETADGNDQTALELYLWNTEVAQAVLRDVSFFEVALRNAYDKAISSTFAGNGHWLFDDASPVRRPILRTNRRGQINDANRINRNTIDRLSDGLGPCATPDDVISNLTLGFWAHMTDRSHERDLWIPSVHAAWPNGTSRRTLNATISEINRTRNRAAHHEHLFAPNGQDCQTMQSCQNAVFLFRQLAPSACSCVYGPEGGKCSVSEFIFNNPAPCDVTI